MMRVMQHDFDTWEAVWRRDGKVTIKMHKRARLLSLQVVHNRASIFTLEDTDEPLIDRNIEIKNSGEIVPSHLAYVGTFMTGNSVMGRETYHHVFG